MKTLTFISACLAIAAVCADRGKGGGKKSSSASRDMYGGDQTVDDDSTAKKLCREFETTFVIVYTGPQEEFDESNSAAIIFLQNSIRDVYNTEVTHHSQRILDTVTLQEQSLVEETSDNNRELQSKFGSRFRLLNVYAATGRCSNCSRNSKLLSNDAARKLGEGRFRRRELHQSEGSGISRFNFFLVETLTSQDQFEMFFSITDASISNSIPITLLATDATAAPGGNNDDQVNGDQGNNTDLDLTWIGNLGPVNFTNDSQDDPLELVGGISGP